MYLWLYYICIYMARPGSAGLGKCNNSSVAFLRVLNVVSGSPGCLQAPKPNIWTLSGKQLLMCVIPLSPMVYIIHGLTYKDSKSIGKTKKTKKTKDIRETGGVPKFPWNLCFFLFFWFSLGFLIVDQICPGLAGCLDRLPNRLAAWLTDCLATWLAGKGGPG